MIALLAMLFSCLGTADPVASCEAGFYDGFYDYCGWWDASTDSAGASVCSQANAAGELVAADAYTDGYQLGKGTCEGLGGYDTGW